MIYPLTCFCYPFSVRLSPFVFLGKKDSSKFCVDLCDLYVVPQFIKINIPNKYKISIFLRISENLFKDAYAATKNLIIFK